MPPWGESIWIRVALLAAVALVAASTAVWCWRRFAAWRRKDPEELERLRRMEVNRRGRITAGEIVDIVEPEDAGANRASVRASSAAGAGPPYLVVYKYEVAGVTYEVSQDVSRLAGLCSEMRASPCLAVSVKYDPRSPANSIVACENWNGLTFDDTQKQAR